MGEVLEYNKWNEMRGKDEKLREIKNMIKI